MGERRYPSAPAANVTRLDCPFGEGSERCRSCPATIGYVDEAKAEMSGGPPSPRGRLKTVPVGSVGELIAEARSTLDCSLADAARAIKRAGLEQGAKDATCSASTVFKWVHNGVIPYPRHRPWISAGLDIPRERLDQAIEAVEAQRQSDHLQAARSGAVR